MSIKQLFEGQQAGFTVYSPDCTQSRLWGNIDHAIHESTGFYPIYRRWIQHDYNTIMRFYAAAGDPLPPYIDPEEGARKYDNVPVQDLRYGHLVGKLFLSGPSLLTVWRGNHAVESLLALKGKTHPPQASSDSIRGRFWCDNGVCNLLHVSDDYAEAQRELGVLNLWDALGEHDGTQLSLIAPIPTPTGYIAHSGISVACDVVRRLLIPVDTPPLNIVLPPSGNAKETNRVLTDLLQHTAHQFPDTLAAQFIGAYLEGDVIGVSAMFKDIPVTTWEKFILQCGAITREKWQL